MISPTVHHGSPTVLPAKVMRFPATKNLLVEDRGSKIEDRDFYPPSSLFSALSSILDLLSSVFLFYFFPGP
jgi:hypothetical protein